MRIPIVLWEQSDFLASATQACMDVSATSLEDMPQKKLREGNLMTHKMLLGVNWCRMQVELIWLRVDCVHMRSINECNYRKYLINVHQNI